VSDVVGFMFSAGGLVVCTVACSIALILRPASRRPPLVLLAVSLLYLIAGLMLISAVIPVIVSAPAFDRTPSQPLPVKA